MAQSEKELETQLVELGNDLLSPPPSVAELLSLLDRVENALARVDQTASESMKKAISPSTKALISDNLLTHSDINVRVSVASCMNEITRITAPDAPYDDDQMKEVFKLIVSSFEKLDDKTSPSYFKRTSILETVAKVRSCLVMLDLECDGLIVEMFNHFFRSIRDDHPEIVFSSMETIMILVLEEGEEISSDLISSILDVLKTENKEIVSVARQLAEKVVEKCASKLKPYLLAAVKSQCRCLDDYSTVLANVCHTGAEAVEPINAETPSKNVVNENDIANVPSEKAVEVAMDSLVDAPPSEEVGLTSVDSRKSVMSNGTLQKETDESTLGNTHSKEANNENNNEAKSNDKPAKSDAEPTKTGADSIGVEESVNSQAKVEKSNKQKGRKTIVLKGLSVPSERSNAVDKTEVMIKESTKTDADNAVEESVNAQAKVEKSNKRKGRKTIVLKGLSEPSERSHADDNKEVMKDTEDQVKDCKGVESSKVEERVNDVSRSKEKEKEVDALVPTQKMQDNVGGDENVVEESRSKRIGRGKRKEDSDFVKDIKGDGSDTKKESQKRSAAKKAASASEKGDKITYDVASNKEEDEMKEVDAKRVKKSGKKVKIDIIMSEEDKKNNKEDETKEVDAKRTKKSGKKVKIDIIMSEEDKKNSKEDETKEVDVKPAKKSGKKVEMDGSQHEDKNKGKDVVKTPSKSLGKKLTPKSSAKSTKDESDVKKTIQANSKRKQSPAEEKASKKSKEYGAELVGTKVKVWWPADKTFYEGVVEFFDDVKKKHTVLYNDGEVEILKLSKEKWEIVNDEHGGLEVLSFDEESPEESSETPKVKKVKTITEQGSKQGGKGGTSSKKGDASSSKSKATPKSGLKKKDDSKTDGKSKAKSSKSSGKSDEGKSGKSKYTKSGKKSSVPKPEDDDDDTLKVTAKSKSKSSKSGNKSNTDGPGKVKVILEDSESEDDDNDSDMSPEPTNVSKLQKSQSAKKRKRSEKS